MEQVEAHTLDAFMARYAAARGGEANEDTESEAMFALSAQFDGAYILHGHTITWVGVQNATARMTADGVGFPSVRAAVEYALSRWPRDVYYSENSVARLRFLADKIAQYKERGGVRITFLPREQ